MFRHITDDLENYSDNSYEFDEEQVMESLLKR